MNQIISVDFAAKQVMSVKPAKIPVSKVVIHWAEGVQPVHGYPMEFDSIAQATAHIKAKAYDFPPDGGYNKHKFTVYWDALDADGEPESYTGRMDCKHYSCPDADLDMAAHIKEFLEWYLQPENMKLHNITVEQAEEMQDFLVNYSFE